MVLASSFVSRVGQIMFEGFLIMSRNTATLLSLLMLTTTSVAATESEERSIRAGFTIAAERCASCHVASPHQTLMPLFPDVPKFEDIANRPATSQESLIKFLGSAHGYAPSSQPLPTLALNVLTDEEKSDLASYILSLRNER
jgi:mono/diheme cytochrome c family protein